MWSIFQKLILFRKNYTLTNQIKNFILLKKLMLGLLCFIVSSCTISDRPSETVGEDSTLRTQGSFIPINSPQARHVYEKNLFYNADGTAKTFLCGWADFDGSGTIAKYVHAENYNKKFACNVQFLFSEKFVEGRMIDPNYPDDSKKWVQLFLIPATHYFKEKRTLQNGRKTDQLGYTDKSFDSTELDPLKRPYVGLNFDNFKLRTPFSGGDISSATDDIVVEYGPDKRSYLAFSMLNTSAIFGGEWGWKRRFNFYEIKKTPNFKKTFYSKENSQYVYPVFQMGRLVNGTKKEFYTAKWALDETKPIKMVLNNWPDEHKNIAIDVLETWNEALTQAMHPNQKSVATKKYFVLSNHKPKYAFDLRYSSMSWIADKVLSANGPLGVAMVNPDVISGEILWGNVNVYGGSIDRLVSHYLDSVPVPGGINDKSSLSNNVGLSSGDINFVGSFDSKFYKQSVKELSENIGRDFNLNLDANRLSKESIVSLLFGKQGDTDDSPKIDRLSNFQSSLFDSLKSNNQYSLFEREFESYTLDSYDDFLRFVESVNSNSSYLGANNEPLFLGNQLEGNVSSSQLKLENEISLFQDDLQYLQREASPLNNTTLSKILAISSFVNEDDYLKNISNELNSLFNNGQRNFSAFSSYEHFSLINQFEILNDLQNPNDFVSAQNDVKKASLDSQNLLKNYGSNLMGPFLNNTFDLERTASAYAGNFSQPLSGFVLFELKQKIVKEILSHEIGHFMGLGHNFKENILPKYTKHKYPTKVYNELQYRAEGTHGHEKFTNVTSIMGYASMETVLNLKIEDIKPQVQDVQVLTYIYSYSYPILKDDDFYYVRMDLDLFIPADNAFFPHCGDWWVELGADPYCSRFDRGYDALTIIENTYTNMEERIEANILSNSDVASRNVFKKERSQWASALRGLSIMRHFYDYMRKEYKTEFDIAFSEASDKPHFIYSFADICSVDYPENIDEHIEKLEQECSGATTVSSLVALASADEESGTTDDNNIDYRNSSCASAFWYKTFKESAEQKSHSNSSEAPEMYELCRGNKYVLDKMKIIAQKKSLEFSELEFNELQAVSARNGAIDSELSVASGGMLSYFPLKLIALSTLLTPFPTRFTRGMSRPIFQYQTDEGFFEYKSFYPKAYAEIISNNALNNIGLTSTDGQAIPKISDIRIKRLLMAFGSMNSQWSNDKASLSPEIKGHLKGLLGFSNIRPGFLVLDKQAHQDDPTRITHFTGTFTEFGSQEKQSVREIYVLDDTSVLAKMDDNSIIYTMTKLRWITNSKAVSIGLYTYNSNEDSNPLSTWSVSYNIIQSINRVVSSCIEQSQVGPGLKTYFGIDNVHTADSSNKNIFNFHGFKVPDNISFSNSAQNEFKESVKREYSKFWGEEVLANDNEAEIIQDSYPLKRTSTSGGTIFKLDWAKYKEDTISEADLTKLEENGSTDEVYGNPKKLSCDVASQAAKVGIIAASAVTWDWQYSIGLLFDAMKRGN